MRYKKPIYQIRKDPVLADPDDIKPYGDRVEVYSETEQRELTLKLLDFPDNEDVVETKN